MQQRTWYVTKAGVRVDWSTAVVGGIAAASIYQVIDLPGTTNFIRTLWRATGSPVTVAEQAAAVAAASSDPVPEPPADQNPGAVWKVTATKVTAKKQWDFELQPTVNGQPFGTLTETQVKALIKAANDALLAGAPARMDTFMEVVVAYDAVKATADAAYVKPGAGIPLSDIKVSDLNGAFVQQPVAAPSNGQVLTWDTSTGKPKGTDRVGLAGGGEKLAVQTTAVGSYTVDPAQGVVHRIVLGTQTTLAFTAPATGTAATITLVLVQDAAGGRLVVWPASVKWAGGVAPTFATTSNAVNVVTLLTADGGTTWLGFLSGADLR